MRLEHHLVGGYVRYISPHIIIIIIIDHQMEIHFHIRMNINNIPNAFQLFPPCGKE